MPSRFACLARLLAAVLLATSAVASHAQAPQVLPSIHRFFDSPKFGQAKLSPNGKLLALVTSKQGVRDTLTVVDMDNRQTHDTASFRDVDISEFQWVNDQRLAFTTVDRQLALGDRRFNPGLYAVNYDGSHLKQLASRKAGIDQIDLTPSSRRKQLRWNSWLADDPGAQNTDSVFVTTPKNDGHSSQRELLLLNTSNSLRQRVESPDQTRVWAIDNQGEARIAVTLRDEQVNVYYRESGAKDWSELPYFAALTDMKYLQLPALAFGPPGTLYVAARNGKDKKAVYALDVASGKLSLQPLITTDYDFEGSLIMSKDRLLGFRVTTDAESTIWVDPAMKALQADIDQRLGNTVNLVSVPIRPETPWVLVESYSDLQPRSISLYNKTSKTFTAVGDSYPGIAPQQMGRQEMVRYKARDGLDIPALLTLPAGGKATQLPLVVLVHGGPYVRGNPWGWSPRSQFLASRGYAVLEPFFRGTTGLGERHYRAGTKQWGLAMQNDLADGARWAIAQGIVDAGRICIAGGSYGGYAALMGLVNDPDLYRCAVNWAGVTDINLMYTGHWSYPSDMSEWGRKNYLPSMVGDQVADAAQLTATSPLMQAARIRQPLLLAYGGADKRVPLYHGSKFHAAVSATNKNVEWVEYPKEGHGWFLQETRIDFWSRVEKFLDRHIGK